MMGLPERLVGSFAVLASNGNADADAHADIDACLA